MADHTLSRKIAALKRQKMATRKVVSLEEFRNISKNKDAKTLLVVDDDEIMRTGLKRILEGQGFRVYIAEDGLELSQTLEHTKLDLILLDINLPWVDGFELCKMIKSHQALKMVPLILVSARRSKEDIEKGMELGADDYVSKPFEIEYIIRVIEKQFDKVLA